MLLNRRQFIKTSAGLYVSAAMAQVPGAPTGLRAGKQVLTGTDFTYLGSFNLPLSSGGIGTDYCYGLSHRYLDGNLRFFGMTRQAPGYEAQLYEYYFPGLATSSYPTATVARHWGDAWGDKLVDESDMGGLTRIFGLYWDATDGKLYWNYGNTYNASVGNNPCLGVSTLNDSTGVATPLAAYRMGSCKMHQYGMTALPSWLQSYVGGKRLAVGFGGRASAMSTGPGSDGPVLSAIAPPTGAHLSTLDRVELMQYPFACSESSPYSRRPAGATDNDTTCWTLRPDGETYRAWTQMDFVFQSGVWIETATKHGFCCFPVCGTGSVYYQSSDIHSEGLKHYVFIYDPLDFKAVAQGSAYKYEVIPDSWTEMQYPRYGYPRPAQTGEPYASVQGVTFDETTDILYLLLGWGNGSYGSIVAYQVAA